MNEIEMQIRSYQIIDKICKNIPLTKLEFEIIGHSLILGILEKGEQEIVNDYFEKNSFVFMESDFSKLLLASLVQKGILMINSNDLHAFLTEKLSDPLFTCLITDFNNVEDKQGSIIDTCFENQLLNRCYDEVVIMINDKTATDIILSYDLKYRVVMNHLSNLYINMLLKNEKILKKIKQ